ncbi:unnamed protein product [Polarella glacialis]|uniref:Glycosyltransferase family 92 protein n=1 Tax=Polarella glacialis TaxID=89957 RepID=A0A813JU03_POLGL|nr:unnamed protein product [Polarella glacialis]CAE8688772.1 unnamed protein product [Polarella glacialis]
MLSGQTLNFQSVVPVFGQHESYIALIHPFDQDLWTAITTTPLYCAAKNSSVLVPMTAYGGENEVAYQQMMVLRCQLPTLSRHDDCHSIVLFEGKEHSLPLGALDACQNTDIAKESYKMVSCQRFLRLDTVLPGESSSVMLPQWVEYNLMHGVDQIIFYTMNNTDPLIYKAMQPYLDQGLASQVHADFDGHLYEQEHLFQNDCLYRFKHRAEWMMTSLDLDEYLLADSTFPETLSSIASAEEAKGTGPVSSVSFPLYRFHLKDPKSGPCITSTFRSSDLQPRMPKFIIRPSLVHAVFVHYPTSWDPASIGLKVPSSCLVAFHYRNREARLAPFGVKQIHYRTWNISATPTQDERLKGQAAKVRQSVEGRFQLPWPSLIESLLPISASPFSLITSRHGLRINR